ncbi:MAG TPA: PilN domain-containing protein [Candidatus Methylomirabilis sp.]|nr:PilN domain-containing protein [Candidatus Methylomirabilis sp.]
MIKINLLPREERVKRAPLPVGFAFGIFCVLVLLGAMGFGWYVLSSTVSGLEAEIARTQAELRRFDELAKQVDRFRAEKKRLEEKIKIIETLVAAQGGPVRLLDEVSKALPAEVWLTSLNRTGKRLEMSGIAFSNFNVAALMTNLGNASNLLTNVDLVISEKTTVEDVPVERFTITAEVKEGKI